MIHTTQREIPVQNESSLFSKADLLFLAVSVFLAGCLVKLPAVFNWNEEYFYPRNIGFIVFPFIMAFFSRKQNVIVKSLVIPFAVLGIAALYINMLPDNEKSDTLVLSCIHLPILIWSFVGYAFTGNDLSKLSDRVAFLRFNGDLVVMSSVLALAGALFTVITMGLYELIGIDIREFYVNYVVAWGVPAIPLLATVLVTNQTGLVGRVSPIIAKIFTPVVGLSLAIFLGAVISTGKDPYNDREFLMVFNALLIGVMAIILFSLSEMSKGRMNSIQIFFLVVLAILTVIDNGMALSAILYRVGKYGMTANRLAVLGSNLIMLANLILISYQLIRVIQNKSTVEKVETVMAQFLPLYTIWCGVVVFVFPLAFGFK